MPENFPVDTSPLLVAASLQSRKQILVGAGATIYYKSDRTVSPSSNDGSIALGGSLPLTDNTWIASGSQSRIVVTDLEGAIAPGTGAGRTDTSGIFHDVDIRLYGEIDTTRARGVSTLVNKALADVALKGGTQAPTSLSFPAGRFLLDAPLSPLATSSFTLKTAGRASTQFYIPAGASFNTFFRVTGNDVTIEPCWLLSDNTPILPGGFFPKGTWNASTNKTNNGTTGIFDGIGALGDTYFVEVGAAHDFGHGSITFATGDYVYYTGSVWQRMASPYGFIVDNCTRANATIKLSGSAGIELGPTAIAVGPEILVKGSWNSDFGLPAIMGWRHSGVKPCHGNIVGAGQADSAIGLAQCGMHEINALDGIDGGEFRITMQSLSRRYWWGRVDNANRNKIVNQHANDSTYDHWSLGGHYVKNNGGTEEYRYNHFGQRYTADNANANGRPVGLFVAWNGVGSPYEANHCDARSLIIGGGSRAAVCSAGNEVYLLHVSASGGTYTITAKDSGSVNQTTAAINFDAFADTAYGDANAAATVQAKLEAAIGTGNVRVFGGTGAPGMGYTAYLIVFRNSTIGTNALVSVNGSGLTINAGDRGVSFVKETDTSGATTVRDFSICDCGITSAITGGSTPHREAYVTVIGADSSIGLSLTGNRAISSGSDNVARTAHFVELLDLIAEYVITGNRAHLEGTFATVKLRQGLPTQTMIGNSPSDSDTLYLKELATDPDAAQADGVVVYAKDSGAGKTQLASRFSSGAVQVPAVQP